MFSVEFRYRARKIYKSVKQIVELVSNVLLFLASFLAIILVIYRFGFDMPADYSHEIYYTYRAIVRLFVVLGLLRFLFNFRLLRAEKGFWIEVLVLLFLFALTKFSKHFDRLDFEADSGRGNRGDDLYQFFCHVIFEWDLLSRSVHDEKPVERGIFERYFPDGRVYYSDHVYHRGNWCLPRLHASAGCCGN